MSSPADSKGFPPGIAEQMVLKSYRKYTVANSNRVATPPCAASQVKNPKVKPSHISTWNGGVTQRYRWSQSIGDLTVEIVLPSRMESKTDLVVSITDSSITMKYKGDALLQGVWVSRIHSSESTWVIEDGESIILSLEKAKEEWWESLLVGDPKIDTSQVESKKRIDEYHPETQAAIRKILHDEQMKRTGQDSHTLKLKEAWDAEGSPFKGMPFDPSLISPQTNFSTEQS